MLFDFASLSGDFVMFGYEAKTGTTNPKRRGPVYKVVAESEVGWRLATKYNHDDESHLVNKLTMV